MAEIKVIGNDVCSVTNDATYKLKNNITPDDVYGSDDFWYDLFEGGYITPEQIFDDKALINKVNKAIKTLELFKEIYTSVSDYMFEVLED